MLPIRTILHPTDFSEHSHHAFRLACALARDYGARLVVAHVVTPPEVVYSEGVIPPRPANYEEQLREQLHELVAPGLKVPVEHHLIEGEAVPEILRLAGEAHCDVIVLGTHGRTGIGRLLMGSVAEQVVRRAACPVLTVKVPPRQPVAERELAAAGSSAQAER